MKILMTTMILVIKANKVKIVKEVKRSDGL